ncbi:hypothetical protein M501DRAFT_1005393 [Patellaria atrata CBS 101060]|uniref:Methyltransferase domain-containing protein n=1 Tax=Patellaria atrata CBS 101060 TaxID=1346257 RepID=A0A9P4VUL5_9PEZI|nr:hypothetical protein M501DRAFT_1005393 [Patellaria atrata CBS 101060]
MSGSRSLHELSQPEYWNTRYSRSDDDGTFEWFKSFKALSSFFEKRLPNPSIEGKIPRILHLGCGNSTLPIDLYNLGYKSQACVDFSEVVIKSMAECYMQNRGIEWKVADVRSMMEFANDEFDVAIDKGTLDSMLHGSLWDPPEDVRRDTGSYLDQVARVLRKEGRFLYITYQQPHFIIPLLERNDTWRIEVIELTKEAGSFDYFGFVMDKKL